MLSVSITAIFRVAINQRARIEWRKQPLVRVNDKAVRKLQASEERLGNIGQDAG